MKRDQAIVELGQKLIKELDDRDITAKWMAAHLSELIVRSETNADLEEECRNLILMLWRERRHYPGGDPMQRYARALDAMELLLSTGDPVFEVWMPRRAPREPDEDTISIVRKLKHRTSLLTSMLVKLAVEELGLDKGELAEIADIADPDEETRFLNVLRIVVYDKEKRENQHDTGNQIRESISDLRDVLDDLEAALQQKVSDPKLTN
ncbi:hypothetical protein [Pelagibius sp. Alg239-R121]|uniref:hypothetical protein n=1 Tax=Pelagibius sp. Alg239-R121 TaxID=2993448 RepID=UPI0024A64979|nr:hypothetical protein [Pelagibius sp. Alg239-R121]